MTVQFHEGQEVEVEVCDVSASPWAHAKIVGRATLVSNVNRWHRWHVQFPDGTRGVFDAEHIRAVSP